MKTWMVATLTIIILFLIWVFILVPYFRVDVIFAPRLSFDYIADDLKADMAIGDETLKMISQELKIDKGDSELTGLGIKNPYNRTIEYGYKFLLLSCPDSWKVDGKCRDNTSWFEYFRGDSQYEVKPNDIYANKFIIIVPKGARSGIYEYDILAYEGKWRTGCPGDFDSELKSDGCSRIGQTYFLLSVT